jgi:hypothetical protein
MPPREDKKAAQEPVRPESHALPPPVRPEDRDQAAYDRDMAERARPDERSEKDRQAEVERIAREAPPGYSPTAG